MVKVIYIKILFLVEKFFNKIINRFNRYKYLIVFIIKILDEVRVGEF